MKHLMVLIIKLYQKIPGDIHNACRFTPTCSNYAIDAYTNYGFFKGSYLTVKRLIRCTPFGPFGYDPVPRKDKKDEKII